MYEPITHPPIPSERFIRRVLLHIAFAFAVLLFSVVLGMAGYEYYEKLSWRSASLNAAMLLGGMGPVDAPRTDEGKLFASLYALYAGLVFLIVAGLILAPVVHRIMHKFHWEQD